MQTTSQKKNHKTLIFLLVALLAIAAIGLYFVNAHRNSKPVLPQNLNIDGTLLPEGRPLKSFKLTDTENAAFTNANLKGKNTLMFFGFTNCGYVCPTTMAALNQMYQKLEQELPAKYLPQVIMVSVDPARDSVAKMKSYVTSYNKHFIGGRTNIGDTVALEKQFSVVAVKVKDKNSKHYTISHSANVMYIDPQGQLRGFLSYPHKGSQMAHDYKVILNALGATV